MAPRGRPAKPSTILAAVHEQSSAPQTNPLISAIGEARGGNRFDDRDLRVGVVIGMNLGFLLGRVSELAMEADKATGPVRMKLIGEAQYYLGLAAVQAGGAA